MAASLWDAAIVLGRRGRGCLRRPVWGSGYMPPSIWSKEGTSA